MKEALAFAKWIVKNANKPSVWAVIGFFSLALCVMLFKSTPNVNIASPVNTQNGFYAPQNLTTPTSTSLSPSSNGTSLTPAEYQDLRKYCDFIIDHSQITDGGTGLQDNSDMRVCIVNGSVVTRNGIDIQINRPSK